MQRSTAVNTQNFCGFLELLLAGLGVIHVFVVVVIFILVTAAGRSVAFPLLGVAAASPPPAGALRTGSSSTSLGLLLVASLVFGLLQLNELLDLLAALEVMAFGAVDLAVLFVGVVLLVSGRHSLAVGACGNLLAGATSLCCLGATLVAGLLDN